MIINGKQIAASIVEKLKPLVKPGMSLTAVLIDHQPGLAKFVELKKKAAQAIGISFSVVELPQDISQEQLVEKVAVVASDSQAMLIELPLPDQINAQEILNLVSVAQDVDVLSQAAQELFYQNKSVILPPTVEALSMLLDELKITVAGKTAAVFGQGNLVGKPISHWLETQGATVHHIDEFTPSPDLLSKAADIVITGVGKPHFIKSDMIKDGAVVIDFGYENKDGRMVGDIDPAVSEKASIFTPVPGGMGPLTIAAVLKNVIKLQS